MSQLTASQLNYADAFSAHNKNHQSEHPKWLRELRSEAFAAFQHDGFPIARRGNESWKYTDIRELASQVFQLPTHPAPSDIDFAPYDLPCPRVHQLVFIDGRYAADLSTEPPSEATLQAETIGRRNEGLIVGRLADAITHQFPLVQEHLGKLVTEKAVGGAANAFACLNTAFLDDGALVYVPDGVSVHEPIYLLFITTGVSATVTHPRVLVVAGANSRATLIQGYESISGNPASYFTNAITEIIGLEGSSIRHYKLQRESGNAFHIAGTHAILNHGSRLTSVTLDLGGSLVRHDLHVTLAGKDTSVELNGLYIGSDNQHIDNHTFVDHAVADTQSKETYKGVMGDRSQGVFVGHVLVRPDASRTTAHQVNKNLLLAETAEVDSQPKLEIFTDDVQCTHGAAIGRLDPNAMFYLNSRGLDDNEAQELLLRGFVTEISESIEDDAVRQYTDRAILSKIG